MPAPSIDADKARALVQPYYDALLAATPALVRSLAEGVTAPDWRNCNDEAVCETPEQAIERWSGHRSFIPDMDLHIREVLVAGNKVIVRGQMTGSPRQPLMCGWALRHHGR